MPPFWHRHPELVWELSALHLHWLCAYDPDQDGSAPCGWHRDFADARQRLRDWIATSGTLIGTRPADAPDSLARRAAPESVEDTFVTDRDEDFARFVLDDVARRRRAEDDFHRRNTVRNPL